MAPPPDVLATLPDRVRRAAAAVAGRARSVGIDHARLGAYVATLPVDAVCRPALAPGELPAGDEDATVSWVLTVNAVNFGSGFFPVLRKGPGLSGSRTVFARHWPTTSRRGVRSPSTSSVRPRPRAAPRCSGRTPAARRPS